MPTTTNHAEKIYNRMQEKLDRTQDWVEEAYGDDHQVIILGPDVLMSSNACQEFTAEAIARILYSVYGDNYPYSLKHPDKALAELQSGRLQPYIGGIARKGITHATIIKDPSLLNEVIPAAITARLVDTNGGQEAGRTGKPPSPELARFGGGIPVLRALHDWHMEGREGSPVIYADVRATKPHIAADGTAMPSSGPTQWLYIGEGGLRLTHFAPQYALGPAVEPFAFAKRYRDEAWSELLDQYTIYTPSDEYTELLQAFCHHQTGKQLPHLVVAPSSQEAYTSLSPPEMHGPNIYAKTTFVTGQNNGTSFDNALATLDAMGEEAPLVIVDVPAHTKAGAATQARLLAAGFVLCGFEPAHTETDPSGGKHIAPPKATLARLGSSTKKGELPLVDPYFPPGLYSQQLERELERIHARFKAGIITGESRQPA